MTDGILCAIDFSEASKQALKWAVGLAGVLKSDLTVLYAYRITKNSSIDIVSWKKKMEEEAIQKFAILEQECLKNSGILYDFKSEVGFVTDRIEDHTRKKSISFLVIDKNMSTKSKETFDDLIEHIHVPLVIVP